MTKKYVILMLILTLLSVNVIQGETQETKEVKTTKETRETSEDIDLSEDEIATELTGEKVVYEQHGLKDMDEVYVGFVEEAHSKMAMPIDIIIDEQFLETDVDGMIINNTTYMPLRAVAEAFYMTEIEWDAYNYKAIVGSFLGTMEFPINQKFMVLNGEEIPMTTPTLIVDGRTMVPLRFISELLGFQVEWDPLYYAVRLSHETLEVNQAMLGTREYSVDEMMIFSKLVMREAGSVSYEAKHGVASVVMNHVRHDYFEDTVFGVIFYVHKTPHFPPAHKSNFNETVPNRESVLAAKRTLRGENSVEECIYFNTRPFKGKTIYKVVDGVYFCY